MSGPNLRSRVLQLALGLALVAIGATFAALLWTSCLRARETRRWTPARCVIVSSQVMTERPSPSSPPVYRAAVRYRYEFHGAVREGARIRRVDGPASDRSKAEALCARYPPGSVAGCHVNPAEPEMAVLEHDSQAGLYALWFPLLFAAGGGGMAWAALRRTKTPSGKPPDHSQSSVENPP